MSWQPYEEWADIEVNGTTFSWETFGGRTFHRIDGVEVDADRWITQLAAEWQDMQR